MDELEVKVGELMRAGYTVRLISSPAYGWECTLFRLPGERFDASAVTAREALDAAVTKKGGA